MNHSPTSDVFLSILKGKTVEKEIILQKTEQSHMRLSLMTSMILFPEQEQFSQSVSNLLNFSAPLKSRIASPESNLQRTLLFTAFKRDETTMLSLFYRQGILCRNEII